MNELGDRLRAMATARGHGATDWSLAVRYRAEVRPSSELERILALPRRTPYIEGHHADLVAKWSARLRRPDVDPRKAATHTLFPIQAYTFEDISTVGGGFVAAGVGRGKTLISLLLGTVLGAKRPMLLIPPGAKEQLLGKNYPELSETWRVPPLAPAGGGEGLNAVTYQEWSSKKHGPTLLDRIQPDLIIADEAHCLSRPGTARYRRLRDYIRRHPDTRFVFLTGSPAHDSIKNFAHLLGLALRRGSPLPLDWAILDEWSFALDPVKDPIGAGSLSAMCAPGEGVREGFRRRLVETPGVIATQQTLLPVRIVLKARPVSIPKTYQKVLSTFRTTWCTPGGDELSEALEFYRYARELACGFYYKWEPAPTPEWLEARSAWRREVREKLKHPRRNMDSEGLLEDAAKSGAWRSTTYAAWSAIRTSCAPKTVPVWMDQYLVDDAVKWGQEHTGIIWYEHDAVGRAIAAAGNYPLYGSDGGHIIYERGDRTVVASRPALGQSLELQCFNKQLVVSCPTSGKAWEQVLGRTYRAGQKASIIETYVYQHTPEMKKAVEDAIEDARFIQSTWGSAQLLLQADVQLQGASKLT